MEGMFVACCRKKKKQNADIGYSTDSYLDSLNRICIALHDVLRLYCHARPRASANDLCVQIYVANAFLVFRDFRSQLRVTSAGISLERLSHRYAILLKNITRILRIYSRRGILRP